MRMNRVMPERICGKGYFPRNQTNKAYLFIYLLCFHKQAKFNFWIMDTVNYFTTPILGPPDVKS